MPVIYQSTYSQIPPFDISFSAGDVFVTIHDYGGQWKFTDKKETQRKANIIARGDLARVPRRSGEYINLDAQVIELMASSVTSYLKSQISVGLITKGW